MNGFHVAMFFAGGALLWILYRLSSPAPARPYRPYDLSRDDFDLRTLAAGFAAAGIALAVVIAIFLAGTSSLR